MSYYLQNTFLYNYNNVLVEADIIHQFMTINHIFTCSICLLIAERDSSPDHVKHHPRTSSTCSHVRWGSSRSHLQLEPLLQEHCRPVHASSWGLLVLTFSSSPSSKNIVDLFSRPVGVVSFSPSVRAPPPRTSSTCSHVRWGSSRSHLQL